MTWIFQSTVPSANDIYNFCESQEKVFAKILGLKTGPAGDNYSIIQAMNEFKFVYCIIVDVIFQTIFIQIGDWKKNSKDRHLWTVL